MNPTVAIWQMELSDMQEANQHPHTFSMMGSVSENLKGAKDDVSELSKNRNI